MQNWAKKNIEKQTNWDPKLPEKTSEAIRRVRCHWAYPPFSQLEDIGSHPPSALPPGVFTFQPPIIPQKPSAERAAAGRVRLLGVPL